MIDKNQCIMCGACASVCPQGAITFGEDGYPQINKELCTKCGTCQAVCPVSAIDIEN